MLLARADEMDAFTEALTDIAEGRPRILVLEGEAGIGKTALLRDMLAVATGRGLPVGSAGGSTFEQDSAFGVVRTLLAPLVARHRAGFDDTAFHRTARIAARLLDPARDPADAAAAPSEDAALHGLYWLVANLCAHAPLVLAVDDLHWVDPASGRWLGHLAARIDGLPVLLLVTARPTPDSVHIGLTRHRACQVLRPQPLGADAVRALAAERLGEPADDLFAAACRAATGGNPLLLECLLHELARGRIRPVAANAAAVPEIGPDTVARHVEQRLADLPAAAGSVARVLAVLGDQPDPELVEAVAELPSGAVADALRELTTAGLVRGDTRELVHPIVHSAILHDLDAATRYLLHRRAVLVLRAARAPDEQVARHLRELPAGAVPGAVEVLRSAARAALAGADPAGAAALLRRAAAEPLDRAATHAVHDELGRALLNLDAAAAVDALRRAHDTATTGSQRARLANPLAQALAATGQMRAAVQALVAGMPDAAADDRWGLTADAITLALLHRETHHSGVVRLRELAARDVDPGSGPGAQAVLGILAAWTSWSGTDRARTIRLARRALAGGTLYRTASPSFFYAALTLARSGQLELASNHLQEMIEHTRRTGGMVLYQVASGYHGYVSWLRGRLRDALSQVNAAELVASHSRWTELLAHIAVRADVLAERDDSDAALRTLADAGLTAELPDQFGVDMVLDTRGRLRMARGDVDGALADFLACGDLLLGMEIRSPVVQHWRSNAARAHHLLGDQRQAEQLCAEELDLARAWGAPNVLGNSLRASGVVRGDADHLTDAITALARSDAALDLAKAHLELGELLADRGDRADARTHLKAAAAGAQNCGAIGVARRATARLQAAGGKPRQLAHTGLDSLTPAEWQVARLAADGLRNQDIAESLFVTKRTVELHLTNAYRKLSVPGRASLVEVDGLTRRTA